MIDNGRGARLALNSSVGRGRELDVLECLLTADPVAVVGFVYGIPGIGKTTVLEEFRARARAAGPAVVNVDCRTVEPTVAGFLAMLAAAARCQGDLTVAGLLARLAELGDVVVLTLDNYEVFRLMDTWVRRELVPTLPSGVRLVLSGREPPIAAWLASRELDGLVVTVRLDSLDDPDAIALFTRLGVDRELAHRLNAVVRGHPLAIQLAALGLRERPNLTIEDAAIQPVVAELSTLFLSAVPDQSLRQALEALSVVRRTTNSLLAALLDTPETMCAERLARLRSCRSWMSARTGCACTARFRRRS